MTNKKKYSSVTNSECANEPVPAYDTVNDLQKNNMKKGYMSSEEFWKKVEEKRKNFCLKNGIV